MEMSDRKPFKKMTYGKSHTFDRLSATIDNDYPDPKKEQIEEVKLPPEIFISQIDRNIGSLKSCSPRTQNSSNDYSSNNQEKAYIAKSANLEDLGMFQQRSESNCERDIFETRNQLSFEKKYFPIICHQKKNTTHIKKKISIDNNLNNKPNLNPVKSKKQTKAMLEDSFVSLSDISSFSLGGNSDNDSVSSSDNDPTDQQTEDEDGLMSSSSKEFDCKYIKLIKMKRK